MNTKSIITWPYELRRGHSDNPAEGACAMDAVNWLVHGKHGDAPECACPVIATYVTRGNDDMPDDVRQRLLDYLPRIAGSRSPEHEAARMRVMMLGALRVFAPRALDAAGSHEYAAKLRALPDTVHYDDLQTEKIATWLAVQVADTRWKAAWTLTKATQAAADTLTALTALKAAHAALTAALDAADAVTERADPMTARIDSMAAAGQIAMAAEGTLGPMKTRWNDYFIVLDDALSAGPQGEPWSADVIDAGAELYVQSGGALVLT